jgi:hypothetical protein
MGFFLFTFSFQLQFINIIIYKKTPVEPTKTLILFMEVLYTKGKTIRKKADAPFLE